MEAVVREARMRYTVPAPDESEWKRGFAFLPTTVGRKDGRALVVFLEPFEYRFVREGGPGTVTYWERRPIDPQGYSAVGYTTGSTAD